MSEKIVKARKNYTCDHCGTPIKIGDKHKFWKTRVPVYEPIDDDDYMPDQIGIEYISGRKCLDWAKCEEAYWSIGPDAR